MALIKCPGCGLVNFAGVLSCKRCKAPIVDQSDGQARSSQNEVSGSSMPPVVQKSHPSVNDLRREGNLLLALENSVLPARCVKCNAPATTRLKRRLIHMPVSVSLASLFTGLFGVILLMYRHETATVDIGLCTRHHNKRLYGMIFGGGLIALGLVMGLITIFNKDFLLATCGGAALMVGAFVAVILTPTVTADSIEGSYVWLKGAHKDFLDSISS